MLHHPLFSIIFLFTLARTFFQSFLVPLEERIQVRAGDFLGIHYPHDNRSAVPYRFGGGVQATHHHKFTAFHEDLFANYTVTPDYSTSTKRPALKAYVKGTDFCFVLEDIRPLVRSLISLFYTFGDMLVADPGFPRWGHQPIIWHLDLGDSRHFRVPHLPTS